MKYKKFTVLPFREIQLWEYERTVKIVNELIIKNYYQTKSKKKVNDYQKNRNETNPQFHLAINLRIRVNHALKTQNVYKKNKTFQMIGCSQSFLKDWFKFQLFDDMRLENYGKIWCLDHCLPVSSFNLLDENEMKKCFNCVNLRPLYVEDNIVKTNKINMWLSIDMSIGQS